MDSANLEQKRVLLVEDDPEIMDILKNFLNEMGISEIFEANSGFKAQEFIDSDPKGADLVICDWNMPGMSGFSVFRQFRTSHPEMPFIMVTSRNDPESLRVAKESGLESYLVKPLSQEQLQQKVRVAFAP